MNNLNKLDANETKLLQITELVVVRTKQLQQLKIEYWLADLLYLGPKQASRLGRGNSPQGDFRRYESHPDGHGGGA